MLIAHSKGGLEALSALLDPSAAERCHALVAIQSPYLPLVRWMERRGAGPNDGLVPVASALLPGVRHVIVRGSHRNLVASGRGRGPVGLLRRLLTLVLLAEAPASALEASVEAP